MIVFVTGTYSSISIVNEGKSRSNVSCARATQHHQPAPTGISQSKAKRVQEYVVAGRCLLMWLV